MTNEEDTMQAIEKIIFYSEQAEKAAKEFGTHYRGKSRLAMYRNILKELQKAAAITDEVDDGN